MILLDDTFWDSNLLDLIDGIKAILPQDSMVGVARTISATLGMIYLSVRAYAMIIGEGRFEVMQLFRPFVITLVILNFSIFATIAGKPGEMAGNSARESFEGKAIALNEQVTLKKELTTKIWNKVLENTAEISKLYYDANNKSTDQSVVNSLTLGALDFIGEMGAKFTVLEKVFWAKISMWFQDMITWIVLGIFKGVCYLLFFLQLILMHVLLILGPLSLAFSIGGAFKDSWVQWTARYISVSFYSCIGFIILNISTAILTYGFRQETSRLQQILDKSTVQEQFLAVISNTDSFIGYLLIALIVALGGVMSVPTISTWIIHTSGAGQAFFGTTVGTVKGAASLPGKTLR